MSPTGRNNLFTNINDQVSQEISTVLMQRENSSQVKIEHIISPKGYCSDEGFWYDQDEDEFVTVLQGKARLCFEDRLDHVIELGVGDFVIIPAHEKHRVEWTSKDEQTAWLCVYIKKRVGCD